MVVPVAELDWLPAADVAPVRHGRWEIYLGGYEIMCSSCKTTFFTEGGKGSCYCPNCGAKMDREET
jgi:Zn finger protein HypA/HybF involved in hydrogenase expression